jgi:23S rRNA pseudouridine1911/1915/1917 synthase
MLLSYRLTIPIKYQGERLDKTLSLLLPDISRSQIQKSIKNSLVSVNKAIISDSSFKVKENDEIEIDIAQAETTDPVPANIDINIVYEDQDIIVVNKPSGLTTHPGAGNYQDTLVNALLFHSDSLSDINDDKIRPGIVHRLDKDTSGLMVVAKNNQAHTNLAEQIQNRSLTRKYKALVWGVIAPLNGKIEGNIGRSKSDRTKMTVLKTGGKQATTYYQTLKIYLGGLMSLVECTLETGRTHQIRLHMSHSGHSVVGDQAYGHNSRKLAKCPLPQKTLISQLGRQVLHSWYIKFDHPSSGKVMEFSSQLPSDLAEIIEALEKPMM